MPDWPTTNQFIDCHHAPMPFITSLQSKVVKLEVIVVIKTQNNSQNSNNNNNYHNQRKLLEQILTKEIINNN